nr:hypothetical protein [Tanacetum cinerariifolium]
MQQIQDKSKESCMVSFRQLHSHLKLLSHNDLKGTQTDSGFKHAFATLFGQDVETFTGTMFLNMDQLEKQLNNKEFQEIRSMAAFKILDFRDTLIQHMESVKKSINERAQHKREYDSRVNERQMQTTKEKVDESKALDASLVNTKSSGTKSVEKYTSSRSGNDAHVDDADIRPIYDEEPMAKERGFVIAALKNKLRKLTRNSINTKFAQSSILGKPVLQPHRNQSVVRQPTAFKSQRPRISKSQFASQVDVYNDLSKPLTTYYLPKERESAIVKPHHEAEKKTQKRGRNSRPSVMPSARSQSTTNGGNRRGKIFKTAGLRWVPTGNIFTSSTTKVDSEPTNGSDEDITNNYEYEQTFDVNAEALTSDHNSLELGIHDHSNEPSSSKLVPKVVPPVDKTTTSR